MILYFNHSEVIPYWKENMSTKIMFIPKDKGTDYILTSVASESINDIIESIYIEYKE